MQSLLRPWLELGSLSRSQSLLEKLLLKCKHARRTRHSRYSSSGGIFSTNAPPPSAAAAAVRRRRRPPPLLESSTVVRSKWQPSQKVCHRHHEKDIEEEIRRRAARRPRHLACRYSLKKVEIMRKLHCLWHLDCTLGFSIINASVYYCWKAFFCCRKA